MATVEKVHQQVVQVLTEAKVPFGEKAGRVYIRMGSAAVFIKVTSWFDEHTAVELVCPVLRDVKKTPALFEKLDQINRGLFFGRVYTHDDGVWLGHNLLGDHLDADELTSAVGLLSRAADRIDDELKSEFGGTRFSEDG
jgi:hypothetical protein